MKKILRGFQSDESGQATTEYMLTLSIVVAVALIVIKEFVRPLYELLAQRIGKQLQNTLFSRESFHNLRIGR
ncbi:hypothetical protein K2X30_14885 [bacterium]|jgi:Flp pilus assembly pilin Flp|nr:hypothetical protein [bacterium]